MCAVRAVPAARAVRAARAFALSVPIAYLSIVWGKEFYDKISKIVLDDLSKKWYKSV